MKRRILSLTLCTTLLLSMLALAGCGGSSAVHDHDHDHAETVQEVADISLAAVPLSSTRAVCATWNDHQWTITNETISNYCGSGYPYGANVQRYECANCGLIYETAVRANAGSGDATNPNLSKSEHTLSTVVQTVPSECPSHPYTVKQCADCGTLVLDSTGGHQWTQWTGSPAEGEDSCTATYEQTRSCSLCNAQETRTIPAKGHDFRLQSTTPATCTEPATKALKCSVCNTVETVTTGSALGHNYYSTTDCTQPKKCTRCDATIPGGEHTYGTGWVTTASGHKQVCQVCRIATEEEPHVLNAATGKCDICGYQMRTPTNTCVHQWTNPTKAAPFTHTETCSICGATRSVPCTQSTFYTKRTDCTQPEYCACGNVRRPAQARHNFGTYICTDGAHERECLNIDCDYVQTGSHNYVTTAGGVKKCSTCNWTDKASLASHDHVWGVWTSDGANGHSRSCTVAGCTVKESTGHRLSVADCKGEAVCLDCGATVKTAPGATHVGGTEIRNASAAEVGKAGYTGDTYCLGCGKQLSSGKAIPALTESHTHSYASAWSTDGVHHWHACSCGDKQGEAAHTFQNGKCTVCGAEDPNYTAPTGEHIHSWSATYTTDGARHWRVCTSCGETAEVGTHIVVTDGNVQKCEVCGLTLGEIEKEADHVKYVEAAVERFSDIRERDYFSYPVGWAVQNEITNGTSMTAFSPNVNCTQIQILTMLYRAHRAAGSPNVPASSADMQTAVAWASENGIIGANFDAKAPCTRATVVTYMWKAAGSPAANGTASFQDVTGSETEQAVAWAVAKGITNGTSSTTFSPDQTCSRGQIVTFLYREQVDPL